MLQLTTERLHFERYTEKDASFVTKLVTNPEVMKYIGDGLVKDERYARQLISRMQEQYTNFDDYGLHKLVLVETGEVIGHAGIVAQIIDNAFELELGYWLLPNYWGHGYGFEAAHALFQHATEEWELERLISVIHVENTASIAIAEKNGMTIEKTIIHEDQLVHIYCWKTEAN